MPRCAVCGRFSLLAAAVYRCGECGAAVCRPTHSTCSIVVDWQERRVGQVAGGMTYKDPLVRCRRCVNARAATFARQALAAWSTCPKCSAALTMSHDHHGIRCSDPSCTWLPHSIKEFSLHTVRARELQRGGQLAEAAREYEMAGLFQEAGRLRRLGFERIDGASHGSSEQDDAQELLRQLALRAPIGATIACPRCQGAMSVWSISGSVHRCPNCHANLALSALAEPLRALLTE